MAGERPAIPAQERHRLALGDPGAQSVQQIAHALRRLAARPLELGDLVGLADDPQPVRRVDEQVGRVSDRSPWPDDRAQLVDQVGRQVALRRIGVGLPADDADAAARPDAFVAQDLAQRP